MALIIQPFQKISLTRVGAVGADARRSLPVELNGRGFSVTISDSPALSANVVVQVNNSNYLDPTKPFHTTHPVATYFDNNKQEWLAEQLGPGPEHSAKAADFDNYWTTVFTFLPDASNTAWFATRDPWRYMRIFETTTDFTATIEAVVSVAHP